MLRPSILGKVSPGLSDYSPSEGWSAVDMLTLITFNLENAIQALDKKKISVRDKTFLMLHTRNTQALSAEVSVQLLLNLKVYL